MAVSKVIPQIGSSIRGTHATALAQIQWNREPIDIRVDETLRQRFKECVKLAAEHASASIPEEPSPSKPWGFPSNWRGNLQESITYDVRGAKLQMRGRFGILYTHAKDGTYLIYALYLEVGAPQINMLPRPWVTLTLDEVWDSWKEILGASAVWSSGIVGLQQSMGRIAGRTFATAGGD